MQIIARVGAALQHLFGPSAEEAARRSGVIVRKTEVYGGVAGSDVCSGILAQSRSLG